MHMFIEITLGLSAAAAIVSAALLLWSVLSINAEGAMFAAALTASFVVCHLIIWWFA